MTELTREMGRALAAPFADDLTEFRCIHKTTAGKALAAAYIEARTVMTRLDEVVGPAGWSFSWEPIGPKAVKGILTVLGITKCDAGEAGSEDEPLKAAVSDALKRSAVHFGVGRYLYELGPVWGEWDEGKRRWSERPQIAPKALSAALAACGWHAPTNPAEDRKERVKAAAEASPANRSPVRGVVGKPEAEPVVTDGGNIVNPDTGEALTGPEALKAATDAYAAALKEAGLEPGDGDVCRAVAGAALGKEVKAMRDLPASDRAAAAAWVRGHIQEAQGVAVDAQAARGQGGGAMRAGL